MFKQKIYVVIRDKNETNKTIKKRRGASQALPPQDFLYFFFQILNIFSDLDCFSLLFVAQLNFQFEHNIPSLNTTVPLRLCKRRLVNSAHLRTGLRSVYVMQ